MPTRGGRGRPGLGAAGPGRGPGDAGRTGAAGASTAGGGGATGGTGGAVGTGAAGLATGALTAATVGAAAFAGAGDSDAVAGFAPPNASRNRRATGASTVDDADLTNSPCSLSRARTSLLVTPSSFANSCTRALPATTFSISRGDSGGRPRLGSSYDAWSSSGLHGVLMFLRYLFVFPGWLSPAKCSTTAEVSGVPVMRNARPKACRRIAAVRQPSLGCNQAPRPGREPMVSTETVG